MQRAEAFLGEAREFSDDVTGERDLLGFQDAVDLAAVVEDISRVADYLKLLTAASIDRQRPAETLGEGRVREFRSTADYMRSRLRISRAEARRRLALGTAVLPATTVTGQTRPPAYPRLAEACADAALAAADADVIAHALEEALPRMEPAALEAMEKQLTDIGSHQDHDFLVRAAKHWTALLDQDRPPTEEELARFQGIFPGRRRNGLNHLHIYCTDEQHEALTTLINSAANPRVNGRDAAGRTGSDHSREGCGVKDQSGSPGPVEFQAGPGSSTGPADCTAGTGYAADHGTTASPGTKAGPPTTAPTGTTAGPGAGSPTTSLPGTSTAGAETGWLGADTPEAGPVPPAAVRTEPSANSRVLDQLPRPTRPQLLLEGLLAAVRSALASGGLPAAGGLRPQVMVTISHDALLMGLTDPPAGTKVHPAPTGTHDHCCESDNRRKEEGPAKAPSPGIGAFSGPIDTDAVRRIACDADLIPVVLGSKGQVLDLGRAARLFPPALRKGLHARDRGCAFPGCTVPGPWTEAHHVTFWEHGGDTSIGNGMLLCSFHHHLIHQGNWEAFMRAGIPWFSPPDYVDPERRPLRNTYFHPDFPACESG